MSLGHGTSSPGLESALLPHVAWSMLQSPVRNGGVRGLSGLMQQVQGSELRQVQHSTHEVHVTGVSTPVCSCSRQAGKQRRMSTSWVSDASRVQLAAISVLCSVRLYIQCRHIGLRLTLEEGDADTLLCR